MKKFFWVIEDHPRKTTNIKYFIISLLYCVNNFNIITALVQNKISYEYFAQPFFFQKAKKSVFNRKFEKLYLRGYSRIAYHCLKSKRQQISGKRNNEKKELSQGENYNFLKVHLSFLALKQKRNIE